MEKTQILFICRKQFGYSVDNYYHCRYLQTHYKITYLSPDVGWKKIAIPEINSIYISFGKNRILNNIRFYYKAIITSWAKHYRIVILNRSYFFFLFKLFNPDKTYIYDIRSGIVSPNKFERIFCTWLIKLDLLFYKNITIISDSLAKQLNLKRFHILPLGAVGYNLPLKTFNNINLIYVGTLNNRRIEETIEGFRLFINDNIQLNIRYHIYGFGNKDSEKKITESIESNQLEDKVKFHGKILHEQLSDVLNTCNVGVSYIPITPYFDVQPPTKTFEYLLAGMPVIATNTLENAKIVKTINGVLINDNPLSFKEGLTKIIEIITADGYTSSEIVKSCEIYSWENIINMNLYPYIKSLLG